MERNTTHKIVGSNAERTRLHNRQVVLGLVRTHQPVGRAEIARYSGLTTQTVSNIISALESQGYLVDVGRQVRGRGLPASQYAVNANGAVAMGIEVRPSAMFAALVNLSGETLYASRHALESNVPDIVIRMACAIMKEAKDSVPMAAGKMLGAGVVMPGPFGDVGLSGLGQSALQGWEGVDAAARLEAALNVPVILENDATAAAVTEHVSGVATDLGSYCYIYFGTGLGLGVVTDGKIMRGAFGNAGELGHVVVKPGGNLCACGNRGCLETYTSRLAVQQHMGKFGVTIDGVDDLENLFAAKNPHLETWIEQAVIPLSQTIGMIENLFDPQAVILGGAMPDAILDDMIERLILPEGSVSNRLGRTLPRVLRGASGRMTAALGGAALVIHDTITPRIVARS